MYRPRIIPVLLLHNSGVVKTKNFKNHIYIGDPINTVKIFNSKFADELMIVDIDAGKRRTSINLNLLFEMAGEAFMPLSYSGGISSMNDIESVLRCGIEKVCINTATENREFLIQACKTFGTSTIASFVDVKKNWFGKTGVYTKSGSNRLNTTIIDHVKYLEDAGVGEIILQDIDREGTKQGYNLDLLAEILRITSLPVIISGGAKDYNEIKAVLKMGAAGAAAGSLFVFSGNKNAILINFPDENFRQSNVR